MNPNLKRRLLNPFIKLKFKIKERAKIKNAYFSARSIKEVLAKKEQCYQDLLKEERNPAKKQDKILRLEGYLSCISWIFGEE